MNCGKCVYAYPVLERISKRLLRTECRRNPPTQGAVPDAKNKILTFPAVNIESYWCGEFVATSEEKEVRKEGAPGGVTTEELAKRGRGRPRKA